MRLSEVPAQKTSKKESKVDYNSNTGPAPKKAIWHSWSTNWHKCRPQPQGTWIEINLILFDFLEIRTCLSSYFDHSTNFSNIPTSINRGLEDASQNSTHFFMLSDPPSLWLFSSFLFPFTLKTFRRLLPQEFIFCKQNIVGFKELNKFL